MFEVLLLTIRWMAGEVPETGPRCIDEGTRAFDVGGCTSRALDSLPGRDPMFSAKVS